MDPERFGHRVSRYERPNFRYRCGRAALWGKPCARGPTASGGCGGVSECEPYFNGQGYECRRSPAAGGPCEQGPLPDGRCCIQRPACRPRRPLRLLRSRATWLALLVSIVALIGFAGGRTTFGTIELSLLDPGPLTGAHARFTEGSGCAGCHGAVGAGPMAWLQGALSAHDMTESCTGCHSFDGPPANPHNLAEADAGGMTGLECSSCHSEHKGAGFDIAAMPDVRCHTCHKQEWKFASFSRDHPDFGAGYPYETPTAIKFDHTKHFNVHFEAPRTKEFAPESCAGCHDLGRAAENVPILDFETMCGQCHVDQIARKTLTLITFPEFETDPLSFAELDPESEAPSAEESGIAAEDVIDACGTDYDALALLEERLAAAEAGPSEGQAGEAALEGEAAAEGEREEEEEYEYESISLEYPTAMDGFLLDTDPEDLEVYWAPYRAEVLGMAVEGRAALVRLVDARFGEGASEALLAGLDDELVQALGCAWAANEEYEPEEEPAGPWRTDLLTLDYTPSGHADPVLKAWLAGLLALEAAAGEDAPESLEGLHDLFLSAKGDGPGSCNACHWLDAPTTEAATASGPVWRHRPEARHYRRYSHGPHINLLGPGTWCQSCHELDKSVQYEANFEVREGSEYLSNFKPIGIGKCRDCHRAEDGVRQDCLTCHEYHRGASFRKRMLKDEANLQPQD